MDHSELIAHALHALRQHYANGGNTTEIPPEFTSDTAGGPVDFRPLNFDALRNANAVRVTNRANPDGTTDADPSTGFSIVSGWNDAMARHGDPRSTVTWPDNPQAYGTVSDMFANNPEWITPHKYRQIIQSARDLGMRDENVYLPRKADGGFLDGLFSGPDYLSNGEKASFANMPTQDETNADFFKADKALRLAREAQGRSDDVTGSIPVRAPLTAPRPGAVEVRELPVNIPFNAPERNMAMPVLPETAPLSNFQTIPGAISPMSSDFQRTELPAPQAVSFAGQPLAYTTAPDSAPAQQAIDQATGKLTNRVDPNSGVEHADNVWNRMLIQESGGRQFDRNGNVVTSPVGALGMSQVMPSTGPEAARLAGLPWSLERLRTDPEYNHALGRAYYDAQLARFGDPILAAAAYNGGPGRVAGALRQARETGRPWTSFLMPETQNYVRVVGRAEGGSVEDRALMLVSKQA